MNSSCCLCVHSYFTRKVLLNINVRNIGLINESNIWLIEAKIFHIEHFFVRFGPLFEDIYFCRSETIIIYKNVSYFSKVFSLFLANIHVKVITVQPIIYNKVFSLSLSGFP